MKHQQGFIVSQLYRTIGETPLYLAYAVWESTFDFWAAFTRLKFIANLAAYPSSGFAVPHMFQKVAVRGICIA